MLEDFLDTDMASADAKKLAKAMCSVMKDIRLSSINENTGKPLSIRHVCSLKDMDISILSRAENPNEDTVPALSYWLDWCEALNVDLGDIVKKAKQII